MIDAENEKAGRREWIGMAVLALPTLLLSMDISVWGHELRSPL